MPTIDLGKGHFARVDEADYAALCQFRWRALSTRPGVFYAVRTVRVGPNKTRLEAMHRVITDAPKGLCVDHRDGDGLNNQRANLRLCTITQNNWNKRPRAGQLYKGISRDPRPTRPKPWRAIIAVGGVTYFLGFHSTPEEAARAYDVEAKKLFGEFAYLNFPEAA